VIVGTIIGALSLRFIDTVNIWSTAVIGAYLSLQVFATLDYKASQGLAIRCASYWLSHRFSRTLSLSTSLPVLSAQFLTCLY
jgi:hypothetical protein